MKKRVVAILLFSFTMAQYAQTKREKKWIEDIEYLKNTLPEKHIDLFFKTSKNYFEKTLLNLEDELIEKQLSDADIAIKMQQLLAKMGDSHTNVKWIQMFDKKKLLPIKTMWLKEGLFIYITNKENEHLLGRKITKLNNIPITTVIDSLSTLLTVDNQAMVKKSIPNMLLSSELLQYFGLFDKKLELDVENTSGFTSHYTLKPSAYDAKKKAILRIKRVPYYLKNNRNYIRYKYFEKDKIYYVQYNKCWTKHFETKFGKKKKAKQIQDFEVYQNKILKTIKGLEVDKFIFDMRFNSGGASKQGRVFAQKLAEIPEINQKGKLFVVTGTKTFSSAVLNTIAFKKLTNAIVVGEATSGMPNHYGEIGTFELPNSKLKVQYSTKYIKFSDENINTLNPDVTIELDYQYFVNGIDPVYEWIKNYKE